MGISSLQVDFGDGGGWQAIADGQVISINYPSGGSKTIQYSITYSNSQQVSTYSSIYIMENYQYLRAGFSPMSCNGLENPVSLAIEADLTYQGYEETSAIKGEGLATIYYHTTDCDAILKKPIIIIDGFDPGSQRTADRLINENLIYRDAANNPRNFAVDMLSKGYDVIILDFKEYNKGGRHIDGGSDYIQRNAFTLIKLIQYINQNKENNGEQLVIVGPSMGGLISRYALAYMEQNSMPHNTRLWVSFDAPQLGANIPIGDQWMLRYLADQVGSADAKKKLKERLDTYAAKEMLIHHHSSNSESPAPHWTRNSFMNELNNLGYPTQLRKIALTNGSGEGLTQNTFGGEALDFAIKPTVFNRIVSGGLQIITGRTFVVKALGLIARSLGMISALTDGVLNTTVWFTPGYNGRNKVFDGSMWNGLLLKRNKYATTPSNSIGLDNASGGFYDTQQVIADGLTDALDKGFSRLFYKPVVYDLVPTHSFIPVKSSLGITSGTNFGDNFSTRNLLVSSETPFNSYFTPSSNEDHVFLTDCSVKWITEEIDQHPQIPYGIKYEISGPPTVCTSTTYTINSLPDGTTINWSATGSISISGSTTGSSVNVVPNGWGTGTLTASITTPCGNAVITKNVSAEGLNSNFTSFVKNSETGKMLESTIPDQPGSTYEWKLDGSVISNVRSSTIYSPVCNGGPNQTFYNLELKVTNACGQTSITCKIYEFNCTDWTFIYRGDCGLVESIASGNDYQYYPNPAESELNIVKQKTNNTSLSSLKEEPVQVKLYNAKGETLRSGTINNTQNNIKWNTLDISNGTYFLHIFEKSGTIRKQVLIKH